MCFFLKKMKRIIIVSAQANGQPAVPFTMSAASMPNRLILVGRPVTVKLNG